MTALMHLKTDWIELHENERYFGSLWGIESKCTLEPTQKNCDSKYSEMAFSVFAPDLTFF